MFKLPYSMLKSCLKFYLFLFVFVSVQSQEKVDSLNDTNVQELERLTQLQGEFYNKGLYDKFKIYTDSILTIAKINHFKEYEIDAIIRLGVYYEKIGEYDKSLGYYLQALDLLNDLPKSYKKRSVILINLGNLYNLIGYHDKAENSFNESLQYINQFGGPDIYRMASYTGLSESYSANKNYETSLKYLEKAKIIGDKLKRNDILISVFTNMSDNYLQLYKYDKSLAYSEKAEALYSSELSLELRALCLYVKGASLVGLKKYDDAIIQLQMALGIAISNEYLKIQMDTHKELSKAFEKQGKLEKANMHQKGYTNTLEKYLMSLSKAKRLEVEKNLAETEELLKKENKSKRALFFLGFGIIIMLSVILFIYIIKKKKSQLETLQLKEDQTILKDENESLKTKIYKLTQQKKAPSTGSKNINSDNKKSSLTKNEQDQYIQHILEYMEKEKPYLDHEINQTVLAKKLDMSVHLFSEILNICLEKNFNNFINLYRVDRAKLLMKDNKYAHYKLLAIGYESGFPSKTSFNRVFKQLVEQTPSEYRQQQALNEVAKG
ncbi:AraC family transcriptional regulator [Cellulophaga baltica]|uniref:AraC-type DNA-binding protein n=1 Tax=Cellulophaga baltica TaxID=76594 RepID=A0A1G7LY95_9FLAO|nr:AraC family transcriptional regulator [Cellulophaga baltica]SDF53919.1 AraC-type DNA-binding protein [Cellulophaga baltica]